MVVIICTGFVVIHSTMASKRFKGLICRITGERFMKCYYRFTFVLLSPFLMFAVYALIESLPDTSIFRAPSWLKWPMHGIQLSGMLFGMSSLLVLDASEFFGIRQLKRCHNETSPGQKKVSIEGLVEFKLVTTGVYSIVRHPIYLAGIIMISFQPHITYNWLVVAIIADLYFLYAAFKEEHVILRSVESEYRRYRYQVPMFNIFKGIYRKLIYQYD